jgi:hypothetical protein
MLQKIAKARTILPARISDVSAGSLALAGTHSRTCTRMHVHIKPSHHLHVHANAGLTSLQDCCALNSHKTNGCDTTNQGTQLAILFTLWQLLSISFELVIPWLTRRSHRHAEAALLKKHGQASERNRRGPSSPTNLPNRPAQEECQAGKERNLVAGANKDLRYVKLIVQFAYITMFANAFPLASCFALLNNLCQVRVDAYKLVVQTRRPRPQSANGIGLYANVMNLLCFVAIIVNALLLGVTSSSMGHLFQAFNWKVGQDQTETWRYNLCSDDARVRIVSSDVLPSMKRPVLELVVGVCLPLHSFTTNNRNGFPPGETPHEQQYTYLWAMVLMEHCVLLVLYVIETVIPDASATTVAERKGQAEYLEKQAALASEKVSMDPELMRGTLHPIAYPNIPPLHM